MIAPQHKSICKTDSEGPAMNRPLDHSFQFMLAAVQRYLTNYEVQCIIDQFSSESWIPNRQVLWESVKHDDVERWAEEHCMQTLSIALGPLVEKGNPRSLRTGMNASRTQKFMRGAGALFTWFISLGDAVTIICRRPPQRFHPGHHTNFQQNELPILRTAIENCSLTVKMVHPDIKRAKDFIYQVWPRNETQDWVDEYAEDDYVPLPWRAVSQKPVDLEPLIPSAIAETDDFRSMRQVTHLMRLRIDLLRLGVGPCPTCERVVQSLASTVKGMIVRPVKGKVHSPAETQEKAKENGNGTSKKPQPSGKKKATSTAVSSHNVGSPAKNDVPTKTVPDKVKPTKKSPKKSPIKKSPKNAPSDAPKDLPKNAPSQKSPPTKKKPDNSVFQSLLLPNLPTKCFPGQKSQTDNALRNDNPKTITKRAPRSEKGRRIDDQSADKTHPGPQQRTKMKAQSEGERSAGRKGRLVKIFVVVDLGDGVFHEIVKWERSISV